MAEFPSEIKGYTPICLCGRGAYGQVWLVSDVVGNRRALKVVSKSMLGGDWEREFNGLRNYHTKVAPHPNLILVYHIEDCGDFFYYTMEAADNLGDEANYVASTLEHMIQKWNKLGKESVVAIFDSLLDGLVHLHNAGLVHRDIKPDNIVFVNGVPKLSDIGLISSMTQTLSLAGTQAYVPPEILTGQTKEMTPAIDYYALGKTLYRAFSGQQPDDFPVVPHKVLSVLGAKQLNTLVKRACNPTPCLRIRTENEFRAALHGELGWWYDIKYFLAVSQKIFLFPIRWIGFGLVFAWKNPWTRITFVLLLLLWLGSSWVAYQRFCQFDIPHASYSRSVFFYPNLFWRAMKETLSFNMPLIPKYDLYDFFSEKRELDIKRYGDKYLASKERYFESKYPGLKQKQNMRMGLQIGNSEEEGSFRTDFEHVVFEELNGSPHNPPVMTRSRPLFRGLKKEMWDLPPGGRWTRNMLELPLAGDGKMELENIELPLYYELGISIRPKKFTGDIEFVITAADYVEAGKTDKKVHHQMRFKMHSDGNQLSFTPARYRAQDANEDKLAPFGKPKLTYLELEDRFYDIKIAVADATVRVFIDGYAVWYAYCPFYSGKFELRYNTQNNMPLQVNDFSLLEIGPKRRTELTDTYDYPKPSERITKKVINYEGLEAGLPHYGRQAHPIRTKDWYGISTGNNLAIAQNKLELPAGKTFLFQAGHYYSMPYKYQFSTTLGLKSLKILLFDRHRKEGEPPQLEFRRAWYIQYAGKQNQQGENPLYPQWQTMPLYIRDASKYSSEDKLDITLEASGEDLSLVGKINGTIVFQDRVRHMKDKITQFAFEIDAEKPMIIEYKQ